MQLPDPTAFLDRLFHALEQDGIAVEGLLLDHICYRVESMERYTELKALLSKIGTCLGEHLIGGRPIATYRLNEPYRYRQRSIDVVELPAPKNGSPYPEGWEHAEFVVHEDPQVFAARYPDLNWDLSGALKTDNADVRLGYGGISVKFHRRSLAEVIEGERGAPTID